MSTETVLKNAKEGLLDVPCHVTLPAEMETNFYVSQLKCQENKETVSLGESVRLLVY